MIFTRGLRVCLAVEPVDLRRGFEGLATLVRESLHEDERSSQREQGPLDPAIHLHGDPPLDGMEWPLVPSTAPVEHGPQLPRTACL